MDLKYRNQVALLLRILSVIAREKDFALHGGTAINLFYHNMPRLSVDIDLTYIPFGNRITDLALIRSKLLSIKERLMKYIPNIRVKAPVKVGDDMKLYCSIPEAAVKVEVNTINRGITGIPVLRSLCHGAQELFDSFCEIQVVPEAQLFGGKIVAALDRQHPRDLFDLKKMFESIGYTENIHQGFLFCLLSSKRPVHEILKPSPINQKSVLENHFTGMTDEEFTYEMFESTRSLLIKSIYSKLTLKDKKLLMSFAGGNPEWPDTDYSVYPGVQWKLLNINKLKKADNKKFSMQLTQLEDVLSK